MSAHLTPKRPKLKPHSPINQDIIKIIQNLADFATTTRDLLYKHNLGIFASELGLDNISKKVAELCGVCESTVYKKLKQNKENNELVPQKKHRSRKYECDSFSVSMIRRITQKYYSEHEFPTVEKLWKTCLDNEYFPQIGKNLFRKWLKNDCKFKYRKINKKPVFLERTDIVAQRENYLRKIRQYRTEEYKIYYSDETWTTPDQTRSRCWQMLLSNEERNELDKFWSGQVLRDMQGWTGPLFINFAN